jgi:hypothetical protein
MQNPYVRYCESGHVIDCGTLVDRAAADVAKAMRSPKRDAICTLETLRGAERWWFAPTKIGRRKPQGIETPFTAARRQLERELIAKGVKLPPWRLTGAY